MKKFALLPLAVMLALAGCQDRQQTDQLRAEAELTGPSLSTAGNGSAGRSVVCVAYDNGLADVKAQLAQNPSNEGLQEVVARHENFIATQCD